MAYYKVTGHQNRHTNWTKHIILERDDDGNVTKEVHVGVATELSAEDRDALVSKGFVVEDSTAEEAREAQQQQQAVLVGTDVAASGPIFNVPQAEEDAGETTKAKGK